MCPPPVGSGHEGARFPPPGNPECANPSFPPSAGLGYADAVFFPIAGSSGYANPPYPPPGCPEYGCPKHAGAPFSPSGGCGCVDSSLPLMGNPEYADAASSSQGGFEYVNTAFPSLRGSGHVAPSFPSSGSSERKDRPFSSSGSLDGGVLGDAETSPGRQGSSKSRIVVLLAVAIVAVIGLAAVLVNIGAASGGGSSGSGSAGEYMLASTAKYQYSAEMASGVSYTVTETVEFGDDGMCTFSQMDAEFPDEGSAVKFCESLERGYGQDCTDSQVEGCCAHVMLDVSAVKLNRDEYEDALAYSAHDLVMLQDSAA